MKINNLKLVNFRNYNNLDISFTDNINFITGFNGVGKTNVLEAISFLALGKSFVTSQDDNCILNGSSFAKISADIFSNNRNFNITIIISKEGKKVIIDKKELKKLSEMASKVYIVTFAPKDVRIFKDSPSERRKFIDTSLIMLSPMYLSHLSLYKELLKRRNACLKEEVDRIYLNALDAQMIPVAYEIIKLRKLFIERLNKKIKSLYKYFQIPNNDIGIKYLSFIEFEENKEKFIDKAKNHFINCLENDIKRKSSTSGIHLEDILFMLNGENIATKGSQGQNRIASLIMKLALCLIINEECKNMPIVLLDDVLSELDKNHQVKLEEVLTKIGQVFITGTEVPEEFTKCQEYYIENHVMRRK